MNWTKQSIIKEIRNCELGVELCSALLETIREFEHYARVDKRFLDALHKKGLHAYISKSTYSTEFVCSKGENFNRNIADIRVYLPTLCVDKSALTWDAIKEVIEQKNYPEYLKDMKERLEVFDEEVEKVKELLATLKNTKFKCFDFYKGIYQIEDALRDAYTK